MYELIILSLLMRAPAHGYKIAQVVNDIIGPYARISNGRLYPLLARLEQGGFIELSEEIEQPRSGERIARSYSIATAGRQRFHELMMDTTSNRGDYQRLFYLKVSVFLFIESAERLYLIDHYLHYCQTHILHLTAEIEDLAAKSHQKLWLPPTLEVMQHRADQWRLEMAWARRLREREAAGRTDCPDDGVPARRTASPQQPDSSSDLA
ncbi:MAG TPA: helix-turn-helix transcriptional regulator [Ktedonobacteraceae bacterium]|nr:helix-turn-helix transcriptional regulator [Ktedonobacteraceae bacterium]